MRGVVQSIDELISGLIVTRKNLESERKFIEVQSQARRETFANAALYVLDTVDSKTQALLAHVSMMIAVLSLFATFVIKEGVANYLLIVEIMGYVLIAIGLLRCIRIIGSDHRYAKDCEEYAISISEEACFRRRFYLLLLNVTVYITLFFLVAIVAHFVIPSLI